MNQLAIVTFFQPANLITVLIGLYFFQKGLHFFYTIQDGVPTFGNPEFFAGLVLLVVTGIRFKQALRNGRFLKNITYVFNEEGVSVIGDGITRFVEWRKVAQYKEKFGFLILELGNKVGGLYIENDLLTPAQRRFIQEKVHQSE